MRKEHWLAWLRSACAFLGIAGIMVLAGCGGGSGAPNNPYTPPPPPIPRLEVVPGAATIYPGEPYVLTVVGGVPPYRAFSTNQAVLPVSLNVSGSSIVLVANQVGEATSIFVGVQDSVGTFAFKDSVVTVQPAPLLSSQITIQGNANPNCLSTSNTICSGGTGTAQVTLTAGTGAALSGRQVRWDVVQGNFSLVSTNPAQPMVSTLTSTSDNSGNARVILSVPPNTPTQTGLLRATDVTTGNSVTGSFVVQQVTVNGDVLAVLPLGNTNITGPDKSTCSSGVTLNYFIFGGTPPYAVQLGFPQALTLAGVPVTANGGSFTVTTNGTCFINATFVIRDSVGNVIPTGSYPTITNEVGTGTPPVAPTVLVVTPGAIAKNNCVPANTFQFIGTGGTEPYSAVVTSSTSSTTPTLSPQTGVGQGQAVTVSNLTSPSSVTITLFDNSSPRQSGTVTIDCSGGPSPPTTPQLIVSPSNYNYSVPPPAGAGTCVNQIANFVVTGGTAPYTVFFAAPRPGATIAPGIVNAAGQGFQVTGLTDGVLTTNITVQDASVPPVQVIATITCPVVPPPPTLVVSPGTYTRVGATECALPSTFTIGSNGALPPPTPPFTVFFSTPGTPGTIAPTSVAALGGTFTVTVPDAPIPRTVQITVQDSGAIPQFQNVFVDCRP
ncbi:MAG: hypothetical protein IT518_18635 [Burkholderiales bacterium]|nr:hypothetical protein [Burkholderiales bacterium]